MQISDVPPKIVKPFAAGGSKNTIPVPSQIPITAGAASWTDGFPPLTMTPVSSGGVPPSGLDMNGILNQISGLSRWQSAGAAYTWDSAFATAVGGYPKGSRVLNTALTGMWLCTVDNNTTNPDAGGAGWIPQGGNCNSSVYASAQQTLATGSSKVLFDTVEFDQGLWDAINKRFLAPWAGKYRVSGSILLAAPSPQFLDLEVWQNGALAKFCFATAQQSTGNICLPFDVVINCAAADYLEVHVGIPSASVLAGISGSNQPYVFAQCQYLGS